MEKATFSFVDYYFKKAEIVFPKDATEGLELNVSFSPKGTLYVDKRLFVLSLEVVVSLDDLDGNKVMDVVSVDCEAKFQFANLLQLADVPGYFYPNSIAILFPYVRAFVSTITLQANVSPIVLPTMNLTNLQEKLRNNTVTA